MGMLQKPGSDTIYDIPYMTYHIWRTTQVKSRLCFEITSSLESVSHIRMEYTGLNARAWIILGNIMIFWGTWY